MNKLDYLKKMQEVGLHFELMLDLFRNPISAAMQGCMFPTGHRELVKRLIDEMHELDNTIVTEPLTSAHNSIFYGIWCRLNMEVVDGLNFVYTHLGDKDIGASVALRCINDYTRKLMGTQEAYKNIAVHAVKQCGYTCIHCKDGKCTGGFTKKEVECDGVECCECFDSGCPELESWH